LNPQGEQRRERAMPTIHQLGAMVGTLSLFPPYALRLHRPNNGHPRQDSALK
jgi:hypothetical protein